MAMQQQGEPSVEEILASIKKVIARDNREIAIKQRQRRENEGVVGPAIPQEAEDNAILDLGVEAEMIDSDFADDDDAPAAKDASSEPLVTEAAQVSMRESLAALAMLSEPSARPQIVRSGETSLEGMVREMLRPMLAQWLDRNLPEIVERMVAAEISRIAGKKS